MKRSVFLLLLFLAAGAGHDGGESIARSLRTVSVAEAQGKFTPAELEAFAALEPVDTHAHVHVTHPEFVAMLERLHMHLLDICVINDRDAYLKDLPQEVRDTREFVQASRGHAVLCTSFDPFRFDQPGFAPSAIRRINRDFSQGAVAVKIWKNMGMEIKDAHGRYVMPDDAVFQAIYKDIADHHKTLVAHLAEPDSCWKPLDPASPDYWYYSHHPEWHMYGKSGAPSKAQILSARDRILAENPNLRVVGAHLGSMESNPDELAQHFDRYPNFAVDLAARMPYLMMQPRERLIAFITKYQDRLLYATDLNVSPGSRVQDSIDQWETTYTRDWRFLATEEEVDYMGKRYRGLALPQPILQKLFHANALRWFPGILGKP